MNGAAGADQAFLVGERDVAAGADRRGGGAQAGGADDRREHDVDRLGRRLFHARCARPRPRCRCPTRASRRAADPPRRRRTARRAPSRARVSASLAPFECAVTAWTSKRSGVGGDHIGGARPDRAGRAEQRHAAPHARASRRSARTSAGSASSLPPSPSAGDQPGERRRAEEPVDPVEHAAMAGNDAAGILHAKAALHRRFQKVAGLRGDRERHREQKAGRQIARPRSARPSGRRQRPPRQAR